MGSGTAATSPTRVLGARYMLPFTQEFPCTIRDANNTGETLVAVLKHYFRDLSNDNIIIGIEELALPATVSQPPLPCEHARYEGAVVEVYRVM
jgi:hypothetical protein